MLRAARAPEHVRRGRDEPRPDLQPSLALDRDLLPSVLSGEFSPGIVRPEDYPLPV